MTKSADHLFIVFLIISVAVLATVITKDVMSVRASSPFSERKTVILQAPAVDIEKIKQEIREAGIAPHPARYWKEL